MITCSNELCKHINNFIILVKPQNFYHNKIQKYYTDGTNYNIQHHTIQSLIIYLHTKYVFFYIWFSDLHRVSMYTYKTTCNGS